MIIGDAIAINDVFNEAEFKNLSINTFTTLMDFKLLVSKINKDKDEFLKTSFEELKPEDFESMDKDSEEFKKTYSELMSKLNKVAQSYMLKNINIETNKIDKKEFYLFCNTNNFKGRIIEFLYDIFV